MAVNHEAEARADSGGVGEQAGAPNRSGLALLVIAAVQLMLVLDATIVSVALPSIQRALNTASGDLNWVVTAYSLTFGGLLLVGGRAGDIFGGKVVFRAGLVLFTAASLLGGFAGSTGTLIAARALQGVGAAIATPTALSLLTNTFPPGPARNKALGVYGAVGGLGSVVGLLLGGLLTEYLNWRWVLFINVPIAVLVLLGTGVLVEGNRERGRIDVPGALTAMLGAVAVVYGINHGNSAGWGNIWTQASLGAAVLFIAAFVVIQRSSSSPMLPPALLRDRARRGAVLVMALNGGGMGATFYFLTLYMQTVKSYSPMVTGTGYLPITFGIALGAAVIGPKLLTRISERAVVATGVAIGIVGTLWLALLTPSLNPFFALLPAQLVVGLGLGLTFVVLTVVGVRGVDPQDTGIASGLINISTQLGSAIGLSALVAVVLAATKSYQPGHSVAVATTHGFSVGFLVVAGIFLLSSLVAFTTLSGRSPQPEAQPQDAAPVV
ncbi:MFS transporter [Dactylosporangium sp. CA-139066]|uniref:MFS transporter n=1 Tax=Dactylosporangium sp. CA-139066 TaxID=3239930 RepID=UPI003D8E3C0A